MIIIGEKINGAIPRVAEAIENRDLQLIQSLAQQQAEAGADYIDICAGTKPEKEYDAMVWLIDAVQDAVDTPLCVDSPNPALLAELLPRVKRPGIINSVSLEGKKCEILYPLLQGNAWEIVALTCDDKGIPSDAGTKVKLGCRLVERAASYGISPERIHIDPLVLAVSAVNDAAMQFIDAVRRLKEAYPTVKIAAALSNVSYGMPARKLINQNFLALSMAAGLDTGILDPLNRDLLGTILATDVLLNRDRFCRKYNRAYRTGRIGQVIKK